MSASDFRIPPLHDDALPQDRRDLIKARVMASLGTAESGRQPKGTPTRSRRRLLLALVPAVVLLVIAGTAVAAGLLPHLTQELLDKTGIRGANSNERVVARAQTDNGRKCEFWLTSPAPDALPNGFALAMFDANGNEIGSMAAGGAPGTSDLTQMGELWAATPSEVSATETLIIVMGHAPENATTAEVTLDNGSVVRAEVQTAGYFLELVYGPGAKVDPGDRDLDFPEAVHVKAIDKQGAVVEEMDLR